MPLLPTTAVGMASWRDRVENRLTPPRSRRVEILDSRDVDPEVRLRSHRDIDLSNSLLGGFRALNQAIGSALDDCPPSATLLDVGSGTGATISLTQKGAARRGIALTSIALDLDADLVRNSRCQSHLGVCGTALSLPLADKSVDIAVCSLLLHHFQDEELGRVLGELDRVARVRAIVHELRRSRIAAAGIWALSFPMRFHPVSRHDGVTSVLRGFTRDELRSLVYDSTGAHPRVSRHLGFRLVGAWAPAPGTAHGS